MQLIIDLDLQEAVQEIGSRAPAQPLQCKSQDTPRLDIYFVQESNNEDLGATPGLRFGVFTIGNPNSLVTAATFTRNIDAQNLVRYSGFPNFDTVAMAAVLGSQTNVSVVGEVRYQISDGTIARTMDVPVTVIRSLLSETILDTTQAAFTVPAVAANVTIQISNTSWLHTGLNLSIGGGAGAYQVVSITDATHFVAENQGGSTNAAPGTVIPSGTSVGIAQAPVLPTYPDPSIIELTTRKGVANGYAGLNGSTLLPASIIPVDTQTITTNSNGQIASASILTTVTANFTTPAANANVSVTLGSTTGLRTGQYVRIPIAGYYIVESITDGTHAVLQNNGDPFNASSGTTITSGAVVLPAQAATAGTGAPGVNAYTTTLASFTVPAAGATVSVNLGSTAWLGGSGYVLFITGAGYYAISSVTDATHAVLTNLGYAATNAAPGTVISSGATVSPGGLQGPIGLTGSSGANAYDTTQAAFTMPAAAVSVSITITNTTWLGTGQVIYIQGAGYFTVASITSPTIFSATNANYPGTATPGSTIASGAKVSAGGLIGPQGAGGPGLNAFTTLSANFTQPAVNATVTITVGTTAWMAPGQGIYITVGGYYSVSSIGDLTHVTVSNSGTPGNAAPGVTVTGSGTQQVSPAGTPGIAGTNAYTTTTANFTQPPVGSSVTIAVGSTAWMAQNQILFINGGGYYQVVAIGSGTGVTIQNTGATGSVVSGSIINTGSSVVAAGAIGATGPTGPAGPTGGIGEAPTDGQIYGRQNSAWTPVSGGGGGGGADPEAGIHLVENFLQPYSMPGGAGSLVLQLPWLVAGQGNFGPAGAGALSLVQSGPEFSAIAFQTFSATAICDLTLGPTANGAEFCLPIGLGIATWKCKIAIDAIITSTDALIDRFGLFRYNVTEGLYGGFFFEYNYASSANWRCCVRTGAGTTNQTYTDSGVAVAANTWVKLKVVTNAPWTSFAFYINNTLVATITTNPPTTAADIGVAPHFLQLRSAYAALRQFYAGYFYLDYALAN